MATKTPACEKCGCYPAFCKCPKPKVEQSSHATMAAEIAELRECKAELLEALCRLVGGCGQEGDLYDAKAHEIARAAIARAEEV